MNQIFDFFLEAYKNASTSDIILEFLAFLFGIASVWFAKKENILVYPTGLVATIITVYLLYKAEYFGDMMMNFYYSVMSIYGWYIWTRKLDNNQVTPISVTSKLDKRNGILIFIATLFFVYFIYKIFDKWTSWVAYVDTITTAIFFVGMWLMAKRKIENWIFWIIGDIISIPLYFYKGLTFTSFQYLGFTFIAIAGYYAWKKTLNKKTLIS